jgi:hypothetical protein
MTSDTIELVERVRRRLKEHENPCEIAGPAPESAISAAEAALGCTFPPSYRTFLRTFGGIVIPPHLGIVHDFVGVSNRPVPVPPRPPVTEDVEDAEDVEDVALAADAAEAAEPADHEEATAAAVVPPVITIPEDGKDVVRRTLRARVERKLGDHLVVVGMGAQGAEWFCLDVSKPTSNGEYPVVLFDAKDNALDQQFYEDFGQMLEEVMGFVADSLEQPLD